MQKDGGQQLEEKKINLKLYAPGKYLSNTKAKKEFLENCWLVIFSLFFLGEWEFVEEG